MIRLIYPEVKLVSKEIIMLWAVDAYDNMETDELAETVQDAIRILEDLGHITVAR